MIMGMYLLLGVLGLTAGVQYYIINTLSIKNKKYEEAIEAYYISVTEVLFYMRLLDSKQMFEHDDEVGDVFLRLHEIVMLLSPHIEREENNGNKGTQEEN